MEALEITGPHIGTTPQHVGLAIRRSRLEGIFGGARSAVVASQLSPAFPVNRFASGETRALQRYARVSAVHALAAAEEYARLVRSPFGYTPWPGSFDVGRDPFAQRRP